MSLAIHRVQTDADVQRLLALLLEYERSLPPDLRHGAVPDAGALRLAYAEPNAAFLATNDDVAIGCVAAKELDAKTALIQRLFVKPEHRGLGAARALVNGAVAFLRDRHYGRVVLDTDRDRLNAAYRLYLSLGFRPCEPYAAVDYDSPAFLELDLAGGAS